MGPLAALLVDSRRCRPRRVGGRHVLRLSLVDSRRFQWMTTWLVDSRCCGRVPVDSGSVFVDPVSLEDVVGRQRGYILGVALR